MNYPLSESEEPIRQALERLVAKNERTLPVVVIEKVGNPKVFVQFATKGGVLYFDVPKLGIRLAEPAAYSTPKLGAVNAVATLGVSLGVGLDERVEIYEEDQEPGEHIPLWKRLFA